MSKKICYKVYLCKNRPQQNCTAFTGLSNSAKMVGGRRPFLGLPEILAETDALLQKRRFPNDIRW